MTALYIKSGGGVLGLLLIALLFTAGKALRGQQPYIVQLETLGAEQGLDTSQGNSGFFRDHYGFIWISSPGGLHKYSGQSVQTYEPDDGDPAALVYPIAASSSIYQDEQHDLWFCNTLALVHYDQRGDCFEPYRLVTEVGDTLKDEYYWLHLDQETQQMYVCSERKLYVTTREKLPFCRMVGDFNVSSPSRMRRLETGEQELFLVHFSKDTFSIWEVAGDAEELRLQQHIISPDRSNIRDVIPWSDSLLLVGTTNGMRRLDLKTNKWSALLTTANGKTTGETIALFPTGPENALLVTQTEGVFKLYVDRWYLRERLYEQVRSTVTPLSATISSAQMNDDGNVWLGVDGVGVKHFNVFKRKISGLMIGDPGGYRNYTSIAPGREGEIWVTTYTGVLSLNGRDTTYYSLPINGEDIEKTTFVHVGKDGTVWVGTLEWLFRKLPGEQAFRAVSLTPEPMSNLPGYICVEEDEEGTLYFGTNDRGILRYRPGEGRGEWLGVNSHGIVCLQIVEDGLLFGDTSGELHKGKLVDGKFRLEDKVVLGDIATSISDADAKGRRYVGSFGKLFEISEKKTGEIEWRVVPGIPVSGATSVELDAEGKIWTSGAVGLFRYEPASGSVASYSVSDGLQGTNYTFASSGRIGDTSLAFCGPNGVNLFAPSEVVSRIPLAAPTITEILINGEDIALAPLSGKGIANPSFIHELSLTYRQNDLGVSLAAREYTEPSANQFRYTLNRVGAKRKDFISTGSELQLSGLAPAHYELVIQAANADGVWSAEEHTLRLRVAPPFYQTIWAYLSYAALLALLFYVIYRWRLGEATQKERLKTSRAEALRQVAETETSILRLQMNPHFIFNSLNSIDDYILDEAPLRAHDYLVVFAELMRDILNRSTQPLTRLDREISMLEQYVAAERMRVGEGLVLRVERDEEVDPVFTWLPTMILQPFVENAIWHGFSGREEGGTVTLRFQNETEQLLRVEVEDDGRGRGNAGRRIKEHGSKALSITQKRLELLNAKTVLAWQQKPAPAAAPPEARYEIEDLYHPEGKPAGTRVVLYLPLIYPDYDTSSSD